MSEQTFNLDPDAAACLDNMLRNAKAWDLPEDPAGIVSAALLTLHAMRRNGYVCITRDDAERLGLSEAPPDPLH